MRAGNNQLGLYDLQTFALVGSLASAPRPVERAARTASGWLLTERAHLTAATSIARCIDDQGQELWCRELSEHIASLAPSPDGRRIALFTQQRVFLLDAASGASLHSPHLAPYTSALRVTHDQLLTMHYERAPNLSGERHGAQFNLRGERLGALSPSVGDVVGDTLYGVSWLAGKQMFVTANMRSPALPPTALAPCPGISANVCAARGHLYYDHYDRGAWVLRHPGPDASAVWLDIELATLKKILVGACVVANEPAGLIAASAGAGPVTLYEAETGRQRGLLLGLTKGAVAAQFTHDGASLLAASGDKLFCWDTVTGEQRWKSKLPQRAVRWLAAVDASGERLILVSPQGALLACAVETGHLVATAQLDLPTLIAITIGPDDRLYLAAADLQLHVAQLP